jgi:hypothetical protein
LARRANTVVVVDREGGLVVDGDVRQRLRGYAGRFRLVADAPGLLILRRELVDEPIVVEDEADDFDLEDRERGDAGRVIMAGEIVDSMTLLQIIEVASERGWRGDLRVFAGDGTTFELSLDQGTLVQARSTHPRDRLGEMLLRDGVIDEDRLVGLLDRVDGQRRFGQVCLDAQILDRERLFGYLQRQAQGIFFRALMVGHGSYVFSLPDPGCPPPVLALHLVVRPLLLSGVQRIDEMEMYRRTVPSSDVRLEPCEVFHEPSDPDQRAVLAHSDGTATLADISGRTGLGEYAVTRAAFHLVRAGMARVRGRAQVDEEYVRVLTTVYGAIVRDVFIAIEAHGSVDNARSMLEAWINGCGYAGWLGDEVTIDGTIDQEVVLANLAAARDEDPLASFHHIAHELVSFALFCAGSTLPREHEMALSRDVNRRLQDIRSSTAR